MIKLTSMYIWNIEKLKTVLKTGSLSQKSLLVYLLLNMFPYWVYSLLFSEQNIWDAYLMVSIGVVSVFGTIYVYVCNGGSQGVDFIQKYLSLGFVLGVRCCVFILVPVMVVYITALMMTGVSFEATTFFDVVVFGLIQSAYFILLGEHLRDIRG